MQERISRIPGGMPLELEFLEQDLDKPFPDFSGGRPLAWGLALAAVESSWAERIRIAGVDWVAEFYPPNELRVPRPRKQPSSRAAWRKIERHCGLFMVLTGKTGMNDARDVGRRSVRSLVALLRRQLPVLLPAEALWEGAVAQAPRGRIRMSVVETSLEAARTIGAKRAHSVGQRLARVSMLNMPPHLQRALEWLTLARSASVRPEKFMHLWLAILTLASYGQSRRLADMTRVARYTTTMSHGIGGVLSPLSVADLNQRLRDDYKIRNDLLHRADDSQITLSLLEQLESDAFVLVDFELAKLGTPVAAP